jgi:cyclic pyranopterin phosphate synthase
MSRAAARALEAGTLPKGDALGMARTAGILAAKRTAELIPLCHPIPLSQVAVDFSVDASTGTVEIEARARATAPTGVEMEAFTAAAIAAVTIYDMCKALDPAAEIAGLRLVRKSGGKQGTWQRKLTPGRR